MGLKREIFLEFIGGQMAVQDAGMDPMVLGEVSAVEFDPSTSALKVQFAWRTKLVDKQENTWEGCEDFADELVVSQWEQRDDGSLAVSDKRAGRLGYFRQPNNPILPPRIGRAFRPQTA